MLVLLQFVRLFISVQILHKEFRCLISSMRFVLVCFDWFCNVFYVLSVVGGYV